MGIAVTRIIDRDERLPTYSEVLFAPRDGKHTGPLRYGFIGDMVIDHLMGTVYQPCPACGQDVTPSYNGWRDHQRWCPRERIVAS